MNNRLTSPGCFIRSDCCEKEDGELDGRERLGGIKANKRGKKCLSADNGDL